MNFIVNATGTPTELTSFFKTDTYNNTLPLGYQNNGTSINNIVLYMFGTRQKCNYQLVNKDLGNYFQYDTFTNSIEISKHSDWISDTSFRNATWIWGEPNATIDASGDIQNYYYWFYYSFYNNLNEPGTIYIACDNNAVVFLNNTKIYSLPVDSGNNFNTVNSIPISLVNDINYIRIAAYNSGSHLGQLPTNISATMAGATVNGVKYGDYMLFTFTANSSITFESQIKCNILIIGGGGGGGSSTTTSALPKTFGGGGGGAGQYLYTTDYVVNGTYSIIVGNGGDSNTNGSSSSFTSSGTTLTAVGGGAGGQGVANSTATAGSGGSGGGAGGSASTSVGTTKGTGTAGYDGGSTKTAGAASGAGGGGAAGVGSDATSTNGGNGGNGVIFTINGESYCAGGGGGSSGTGNRFDGLVTDFTTPGNGGTNGVTTTSYGGKGNNTNIGGGTVNNGSSYGCGGGGACTAIKISTTKNGNSGSKGIVMIAVKLADSNPAGLTCSVYKSSSSTAIANTNSKWACRLSTNAATVTTLNYSDSGSEVQSEI